MVGFLLLFGGAYVSVVIQWNRARAGLAGEIQRTESEDRILVSPDRACGRCDALLRAVETFGNEVMFNDVWNAQDWDVNDRVTDDLERLALTPAQVDVEYMRSFSQQWRPGIDALAAATHDCNGSASSLVLDGDAPLHCADIVWLLTACGVAGAADGNERDVLVSVDVLAGMVNALGPGGPSVSGGARRVVWEGLLRVLAAALAHGTLTEVGLARVQGILETERSSDVVADSVHSVEMYWRAHGSEYPDTPDYGTVAWRGLDDAEEMARTARYIRCQHRIHSAVQSGETVRHGMLAELGDPADACSEDCCDSITTNLLETYALHNLVASALRVTAAHVSGRTADPADVLLPDPYSSGSLRLLADTGSIVSAGPDLEYGTEDDLSITPALD